MIIALHSAGSNPCMSDSKHQIEKLNVLAKIAFYKHFLGEFFTLQINKKQRDKNNKYIIDTSLNVSVTFPNIALDKLRSSSILASYEPKLNVGTLCTYLYAIPITFVAS